jgi:hypothetical protein
LAGRRGDRRRNLVRDQSRAIYEALQPMSDIRSRPRGSPVGLCVRGAVNSAASAAAPGDAMTARHAVLAGVAGAAAV